MHPLARDSRPASFGDVPDLRTGPALRRELLDVVTIAVRAVRCGADTWVDGEPVGRSKEAWLRTFLALPHGVPAHDTFGRVFAALDPAAFERGCLAWARDRAGAPAEQVVAIDGKMPRRSHDRGTGRGALHLVGAWASGRGLVPGQVAVAAKSNERAAIPALLDVPEVEGAVVTIDAMGCRHAIARRIVRRGADDVLAVTDDQPTLRDLIARHFAVVTEDAAGPVPAAHATREQEHGRREGRRCWASDDPEQVARLDPARAWPGVRSVAAVVGERRIDGATKVEARYDRSSRPADAARRARAVRGHWGIENRRPWVLDVACREDESRVRVGHATENVAVLRQERSLKVGVRAKRLRCGWDHAYFR
jgi:predicted transposase YbfD/YdcC